jgi:hypothetical protein
MLILPLPEVIRPMRSIILLIVVRCQLPPRTVGIPLRFNSFASSRWETKPAAISFRMVEAKTAARKSAARLFVEALCTPRPWDEVPLLTCSIGPSWPGFDVRRRVKNVSRSGSARAARSEQTAKANATTRTVIAEIQRKGATTPSPRSWKLVACGPRQAVTAPAQVSRLLAD